MKKRLLLFSSLLINAILITVFAYKVYTNWFEQGVLKLPFRESLFVSAPKHPGLIFFVGDSHTEAFELNEYLENPLLRNRGVWGDVSGSVLKRIDEIAETRPSKIFIMIGVNDICGGEKPGLVANNINAIISRIQYLSPGTSIYLQSVLPTNNKIRASKVSAFDTIVVLNKLLNKISKQNHITFINLFPRFVNNNALNHEYSFDSLHLNGKGYKLWSALIKNYL